MKSSKHDKNDKLKEYKTRSSKDSVHDNGVHRKKNLQTITDQQQIANIISSRAVQYFK